MSDARRRNSGVYRHGALGSDVQDNVCTRNVASRNTAVRTAGFVRATRTCSSWLRTRSCAAVDVGAPVVVIHNYYTFDHVAGIFWKSMFLAMHSFRSAVRRIFKSSRGDSRDSRRLLWRLNHDSDSVGRTSLEAEPLRFYRGLLWRL